MDVAWNAPLMVNVRQHEPVMVESVWIRALVRAVRVPLAL